MMSAVESVSHLILQKSTNSALDLEPQLQQRVPPLGVGAEVTVNPQNTLLCRYL